MTLCVFLYVYSMSDTFGTCKIINYVLSRLVRLNCLIIDRFCQNLMCVFLSVRSRSIMMMENSLYLNLFVGHRQTVQTMIRHLSHRFSHTNI